MIKPLGIVTLRIDVFLPSSSPSAGLVTATGADSNSIPFLERDVGVHCDMLPNLGRSIRNIELPAVVARPLVVRRFLTSHQCREQADSCEEFPFHEFLSNLGNECPIADKLSGSLYMLQQKKSCCAGGRAANSSAQFRPCWYGVAKPPKSTCNNYLLLHLASGKVPIIDAQ